MTVPAEPTTPLAQAIAENRLTDVAQLLDAQTPIGTPELTALVRLAWQYRGSQEDPIRQEAAEQAEQIYRVLASAGADFKQVIGPARVVDRIAKVQPDWPSADELAPAGPRVERVASVSIAETPVADGMFTAPRPPRGAMHRSPR
jgi:hypothetical protein